MKIVSLASVPNTKIFGALSIQFLKELNELPNGKAIEYEMELSKLNTTRTRYSQVAKSHKILIHSSSKVVGNKATLWIWKEQQ